MANLKLTLTYALEALTTIIVIQSCIIIDTTVLRIGRRSPHNKSSTARISEASSELGLSCKDNLQYSLILAIEHVSPTVMKISKAINVNRS